MAATYEYGTTLSSVTVSVSVANASTLAGATLLLEARMALTQRCLQERSRKSMDTWTPLHSRLTHFPIGISGTGLRLRTFRTTAFLITRPTPAGELGRTGATLLLQTTVGNLVGGQSILDANRLGVRSFAAGAGVYKYGTIPQAPTDLGDPPAAPNGFKLANGTNVPMATSASPAAFTGASGSTTSNMSVSQLQTLSMVGR